MRLPVRARRGWRARSEKSALLPKRCGGVFFRAGRLQFLIVGFSLAGFAVFGERFVILWAGACLVLGYALSRRWGGLGCAAGTALSLFIGNGVAINLYYWKRVGIDIPGFWRQILKMSLPLIALSGLALLVQPKFPDTSVVVYLAKIAVFAGLALPAFWFFSMNESERELVRAPVRRLMRKAKRLRVA